MSDLFREDIHAGGTSAERYPSPPMIRAMLSAPAALGRFLATRRTLRRWGIDDLAWEQALVKARTLGLALEGFDWIRRTDGFKATVLYALCRQRCPDVVVETGVASGASSTGILAAMADNRRGHLFSIDLPGATYRRSDGSPWTDPATGSSPGWRVPEQLHSRWTLRLGPSRELLPQVLADSGPIDLFYHDSEHTDENMRFEIAESWSVLRPHGLLVVDNVDWSRAFDTFLHDHSVKNDLLFPFLGLAERE